MKWKEIINFTQKSKDTKYGKLTRTSCKVGLLPVVQYKRPGYCGYIRHFSKVIRCVQVSLQILKLQFHHVWRRRCCSCRWQWLRHVQGWFRWWWRSQGCLPLHCWTSPPPGTKNHAIFTEWKSQEMSHLSKTILKDAKIRYESEIETFTLIFICNGKEIL